MNLHSYKEASHYDVEKWLIESLDLTIYQKEKLKNNEIIRFSEFYFMEPRKRVKNIWLRYTIIFVPIIFMLLFLSLPFKFLFTGHWGYSYKSMKWYDSWLYNLNI